jgi:hypothetical protein
LPGVILLLGLAVSPAIAQEQASPRPAARGGLVFDGDAAFVVSVIRQDKAAQFESILARLQRVLANAPDPRRRRQATNWRVFKSDEPTPEGTVRYVFLMDPVVPGADYGLGTLLEGLLPGDAPALYAALREAYVPGGSRMTLRLVARFAP